VAWQFFSFADHTPSFSNAALVIKVKAFLVSLGWTVPRSGDAAGSYSSTGDVTTETNFATTRAWFNLRSPDGAAEFSVQRGSSSNTGRIKLALGGDGFDDGTGDHQTTPEPSGGTGNRVLVIGAGSDAAPTYAAILSLTDNNSDLYVVAQDESPWSFVAFTINKSGLSNASSGAWFYDSTLSPDAGDVAPGVSYWSGVGQALYHTRSAAVATGPVGWIARGLGGSLARIPAVYFTDAGQRVAPEQMGTSAYTGAVQIFPMLYARSALAGAPSGYKGSSRIFGWCGDTIANVMTGTRLRNTDGIVRWIVIDDSVLPWDGTAGNPDGSALEVDPSGGAIVDGEALFLQVPDVPVTPVQPALDPTGTGFRRAGVRHVMQRRR
jgi:hypothetical protein